MEREAVVSLASGVPVTCDARRLDRARRTFLKQQARGRFPGGQLVVHVDGVAVLDIAVGVARGFRPEEAEAAVPVTPETRFHVYSAGKPLVTFAVAVLEARGRIDVSARIADYFPEFAANGKDAITVLDVLTHRSGLTMRDFTRAGPERWRDWDGVVDAVVNAKPEYPRGTFAYQPFSFGWVLAEVVRRVTGAPLPEFLAQVLPADVASQLSWGVPEREIATLARAYCLSTKLVVDGIDIAKDFEIRNNSPEFLTAFVPGAGVVTTARGLASFYDLIASGGVARDGRRVIDAAVLARYLQTAHVGRDKSVGMYMPIARGFAPGWRWPSLYGYGDNTGCAGHAGGFSALGFAEPARKLAVAIVTNGNRSMMDLFFRCASLSHAIRRAVPKATA